jgi:hypothetical protein
MEGQAWQERGRGDPMTIGAVAYADTEQTRAMQARIAELEAQVKRLRVGLGVLLESEGGLGAYLDKIADMGRVVRGEGKTKEAQRLQDIETALWPIYDAHDLEVPDGE